ncbi:MAG TPA: pitrilysin family protein [Bacteroidota bacterium]|nr:pitrilysin family protein [Bacteroidota bacterium]
MKSSLMFSFLVTLFVVTSFVQAQAPDRSKPPELGPPPAMHLPPIQHFKLANGIPVSIIEKHTLPLVQVELIVFGGSAMDPDDQRGLASLTASMMEEGAGKRNALQLADAIDYLGASVNASSGQHTMGVSLHTPLSKLDSALSIFSDVALRPTFPQEELERHRKELLTALGQWHDEPRIVASVLLSKTLFGDKHPYGSPSIGTEKTIRGFSAKDLKEFHDKYYHSNNAAFIVVGDVQPKAILGKLEKAFGKWRSGQIPKKTWPSVEQVSDRKIWLVDKPDAAQSVIRVGRIGVERSTKDYFPLIVLNTILGGSFTSRLNQNLREQHGYAYGAGSAFDMRMLPGLFYAAASVQTDATDKALSETMKELTNIMEPVTDEELVRAKNYIALGYPDNFQSVGQIAGQLAELLVYKLPDSYINDYTKNVLAVTKDDLSRVAKKYLDPSKVNIIVVGDSKKIQQGVSALGLGQLQTMTVDDVLGKAPVVGE